MPSWDRPPPEIEKRLIAEAEAAAEGHRPPVLTISLGNWREQAGISEADMPPQPRYSHRPVRLILDEDG